MPKPIPFPTRAKPKPEGTTTTEPIPKASELENENPFMPELKEEKPKQTPELETQPAQTPELEIQPEQTPELEEVPEQSPPNINYPKDADPENCIIVDGKAIEIKPTKLKYFRNTQTSGSSWLKLVPLPEFLTYQPGSIPNDSRGADQILYDFLIAVFDDSEFVRDHYDEFDADQVDKAVQIFGRINHVEEKEEAARKNREAQAKA